MTTATDLKEFIQKTMRMTGPYQAIVILNYLKGNGSAELATIATDLAARDQESIKYYTERLKVYPKQVLRSHGVAEVEDGRFVLKANWDEADKEELIALCLQKLELWLNRPSAAAEGGPIGWGLLRYNLLAKYKKCLLCGAKPSSTNDVTLDIGHIIPRAKGGSDDLSNLQVLCGQCNRAKSDTASEDFRPTESEAPPCIFCSEAPTRSILANARFWILRDRYPVSAHHTLIIPKSHIASPLEMDANQWREMGNVVRSVAESIRALDPSVQGFNFGFNDGESAGQTVFHVHFHVIPRRTGDLENPRGGIRGVIPSKKDY